MSVFLREDVVVKAHRHRAKAREVRHLCGVKLLPYLVACFLVCEQEIDYILQVGEASVAVWEVVEGMFLIITSWVPDVFDTSAT